MKIKFLEYTMEPEDVRFNLYKSIKRINEKTQQQYDDELNIGYGMTFEHCVDRIAKDILADRGEVLTLRQYISEYRKIKDEILEVANI